MTASHRARLVLDRISVPGAAVAVGCEVLKDGPISPDQFHGLMMPSRLDGGEAELLPFILDSGLVEVRRGLLHLTGQYRSDWSVALNLLALLHARTDVNYAFRFIWEALLDQPRWGGRFLNREEVWPVINQLQSSGVGMPQLNSNRMASWLRVASLIGLIQPERSNTFCLVPSERLVTELVSVTLPEGEEVPLARWVTEVEARFCRVTLVPGELHPGWATVLQLLQMTGGVALMTYSDEHMHRIGATRASHIIRQRGNGE